LRLIGLGRRTWGLLLRELLEVVHLVPLRCLAWSMVLLVFSFWQINMYKDLHSDRNLIEID
jgi:hypothetical protein